MLLDGEILSSSAHLINLMVSLVDSGHARLAFHLFGKATNENPDVNQLRQFYRSAVGANMVGVFLTPCILVDSSTVLCWTSPFVILAVSGLFCYF